VATEVLAKSPEEMGIIGVQTYMLSLELNLGDKKVEIASPGKFRFRLATDRVDPKTGLWSGAPLTRDEQRDLPAWRCDVLGGQFYILHGEANQETGDFFLNIRGELQIKEGEGGLAQADLWSPLRPEYEELENLKVDTSNEAMRMMPGIRYDYENMPEGYRHWRLCADKAACAWRIRDERTSNSDGSVNDNLWEVSDYRGLVNGSRFKPTESHIFHDGELRVDEYGVAWFLAKYED